MRTLNLEEMAMVAGGSGSGAPFIINEAIIVGGAFVNQGNAHTNAFPALVTQLNAVNTPALITGNTTTVTL
jgi:hypothetical protein